MKKNSFIIASVILLTSALILNIGINAKADAKKPLEIKAFGRWAYDYDSSGVYGDHPSDAIYDAEDIYYLYKLCE